MERLNVGEKLRNATTIGLFFITTYCGRNGSREVQIKPGFCLDGNQIQVTVNPLAPELFNQAPPVKSRNLSLNRGRFVLEGGLNTVETYSFESDNQRPGEWVEADPIEDSFLFIVTGIEPYIRSGVLSLNGLGWLHHAYEVCHQVGVNGQTEYYLRAAKR